MIVVPLALHVADDDLPAVRQMRGEQEIRDYFMARLLADYAAVVAKGKKALETQQLIRDGAIDAVWAREDV
jgi:hypothetical protein